MESGFVTRLDAAQYNGKGSLPDSRGLA